MIGRARQPGQRMNRRAVDVLSRTRQNVTHQPADDGACEDADAPVQKEVDGSGGTRQMKRRAAGHESDQDSEFMRTAGENAGDEQTRQATAELRRLATTICARK